MKNSVCFSKYETYLREEKQASANTLSSYLRDIRQLGDYLSTHTDCGYTDADEATMNEYVAYLRGAGKSVSTVSRAIASIKSFYGFLQEH